MLGYEFNLKNEINLSGIFIALVVDNKDPKALERIKVRVIGVHDMENEDPKNCIFASHCAPSKGASGEIPDPDDFVYVQFVQGDPMHCIWFGWARTIEG